MSLMRICVTPGVLKGHFLVEGGVGLAVRRRREYCEGINLLGGRIIHFVGCTKYSFMSLFVKTLEIGWLLN